MGYVTSNPPEILHPSLNGILPNTWVYRSTDPAATVDGTGYFTDAKARGMKAGDIVYVYDTDAAPLTMTMHIVSAINADGSADLSGAGATFSTNAD